MSIRKLDIRCPKMSCTVTSMKQKIVLTHSAQITADKVKMEKKYLMDLLKNKQNLLLYY